MAQALASQCPSSGQLQLLLSSACLGIPGATEDAVRHARQPHLPVVWCWRLLYSEDTVLLGDTNICDLLPSALAFFQSVC